MRQRWNPVGPVVLVADDDPAMRDFLARLLNATGFNVRVAMDVPEAVGCLGLPGVVAAVIDMLFVNSDGRSGLDILKHIRDSDSLRLMPVIVLTGFPLNRSVVREVEALRGELWHKPIDPHRLVHRLNQLIQNRPMGV